MLPGGCAARGEPLEARGDQEQTHREVCGAEQNYQAPRTGSHTQGGVGSAGRQGSQEQTHQGGVEQNNNHQEPTLFQIVKMTICPNKDFLSLSGAVRMSTRT